tara:strand:- start:10664 stop:10930 length:267 start_codon:yes stop_codon:yes gene_type:complete
MDKNNITSIFHKYKKEQAREQEREQENEQEKERERALEVIQERGREQENKLTLDEKICSKYVIIDNHDTVVSGKEFVSKNLIQFINNL